MLRAFAPSGSTLIECDRVSDPGTVRSRLECIALNLESEAARSVYCYAMGAKSRRDVIAAERIPGTRLVWHGSLLPAWLSPLRMFVASYSYLVKVEDVSQAPSVFLAASERSMAGLYVFASALEKDFVSTVRTTRNPKTRDFGIKRDPGYFIYLVDADSFESPTGIYEVVSIGREVAPSQKACFNNF